MQSTVEKTPREPWAKIGNITASCSPEKAKTDANIAVTIGFQVQGGVRRNFVRRLWEAAYDEHDTGFRLGYSVVLSKKRPGPLPGIRMKEDKFVRRAVFFWTRNPELPYRVWATVATEYETILYPKSETEAQNMLFDVTRSFEIPARKLGLGTHSLEAGIRAKWGKHIFTERGDATGKSRPVRVKVE